LPGRQSDMNEEGKSKESEDSRFQNLDPQDVLCGDHRRQPPVQLLATAGVSLVVLFQVCVIVGLWIVDLRRLPEVVADEPVKTPHTDVPSPAEIDPVETNLAEIEETPVILPEVDEAIVSESVSVPAEEEPPPVEDDPIVNEVTEVAPAVAIPSQVEVAAPAEEPPQTDLLVLAKQEAEAGRFDEAKQLVRQELSQSPDRVMAYMAMAGILERLERYDEALTMLDHVSDRSADAQDLARVSAERIRLGELIFANREAVVDVDSQPEEIPIPPEKEPEPPAVMEIVMVQEPEPPRMEDVVKTPEPPPEAEVVVVRQLEPPPAELDVPPEELKEDSPPTSDVYDPVPKYAEPVLEPPRIYIVDVARPKVRDREDDHFDEIRSIQVRIKRRKGAGTIDKKSVVVGLEFFDRDESTGAIVRSGITPKSTLKLESEWSTEEERTLTHLYQVPVGSRDQEYRNTKRKRTFYGFVVKVHYNGNFQDESSSPDSLLSKSRELL